VNQSIMNELAAYLDDALLPNLRRATTRCGPWTGDELTAHLAATFSRFAAVLERSRHGNLSPPIRSRWARGREPRRNPRVHR
jgi:hypothetical protein